MTESTNNRRLMRCIRFLQRFDITERYDVPGGSVNRKKAARRDKCGPVDEWSQGLACK